MPRLTAKIEGRGNGIKTCIVNMGEAQFISWKVRSLQVARAIKRPPQGLSMDQWMK